MANMKFKGTGALPVRELATARQNKAAKAAKDIDMLRRNADAAARLLKMLSHAGRLRVLCLLAAGELSVGEINARVDLSQSALSQHLAKLREEGLVTTRRDGQTIYYRVHSGLAQQVIASLHRIYCA